MTPYLVTKSSSDGSIEKGELIWISDNGHLNGRGGWLDEDEWNHPGTNDFEVKEASEYYIDKWAGVEGIRKK